MAALVTTSLILELLVDGMRTMYGPIVGAALIVAVNHLPQAFQEYRLMIRGLLLISLFLYFRNGPMPFVQTRVLDRFDLGEPSRA